MRADYEIDDSYDMLDYYDVCSVCDARSVFKGQRACEQCVVVEKELDMDTYETKTDRRAERREKQRYGPIRHGEGSYRPAKVRKPTIRVNGKPYERE